MQGKCAKKIRGGKDMLGFKAIKLPASYKRVQEVLNVNETLECLNLIPNFKEQEQEQLKRILENKILRGDKKIIVKLLRRYESKLKNAYRILEDNKSLLTIYEDVREEYDRAKEQNRLLTLNKNFLNEYSYLKAEEERIDTNIIQIIICYMDFKELIEQQLKIVNYYWVHLFSEIERKVILKVNRLEEMEHLFLRIQAITIK